MMSNTQFVVRPLSSFTLIPSTLTHSISFHSLFPLTHTHPFHFQSFLSQTLTSPTLIHTSPTHSFSCQPLLPLSLTSPTLTHSFHSHLHLSLLPPSLSLSLLPLSLTPATFTHSFRSHSFHSHPSSHSYSFCPHSLLPLLFILLYLTPPTPTHHSTFHSLLSLSLIPSTFTFKYCICCKINTCNVITLLISDLKSHSLPFSHISPLLNIELFPEQKCYE